MARQILSTIAGTSETFSKFTNDGLPFFLSIFGTLAEDGSVSVQIKDSSDVFQTVDNLTFTSSGVYRVYVPRNTEMQVVVAGTNLEPISIEISI